MKFILYIETGKWPDIKMFSGTGGYKKFLKYISFVTTYNILFKQLLSFSVHCTTASILKLKKFLMLMLPLLV